MKRYYLIVVCAVLGLCLKALATDWITNGDQITEEWLINAGSETGYTDHVRHFKRLFSKTKVRGLLEFGLGFSTKYFIDHCDRVISVEFVTPGVGPDWIKYCIELFRDCKNWVPIAYFSGQGLNTSWAPNKYIGLDSVYHAAAYQPVHKKSYAPIDSSFLKDLNGFIEGQVRNNEIDVAFVDAGVCIRGDLVQLLFNKVPIIGAHDIAPKERRRPNAPDDDYGYGRLIVPENYEEIQMPRGIGMAFWVKKEDKYLEIIQDLKNYAKGK